MVCRFCYVLGVLCGRHGPYELRQASLLTTQNPLHCGLFRVHLAHPRLRYQGKHLFISITCDDLANARKAPEHDPDPTGRFGSACMLDLVPCQLLPYGIKRSPSRYDLWRETSRVMDEWLIRSSGRHVPTLMILVYYLLYGVPSGCTLFSDATRVTGYVQIVWQSAQKTPPPSPPRTSFLSSGGAK